MLNACENERKDEGMSIGSAVGGMFAKAYGLGGGEVSDGGTRSSTDGYLQAQT